MVASKHYWYNEAISACICILHLSTHLLQQLYVLNGILTETLGVPEFLSWFLLGFLRTGVCDSAVFS